MTKERPDAEHDDLRAVDDPGTARAGLPVRRRAEAGHAGRGAGRGDDRRFVAGALTGSASMGREDRWSDVDLAFGGGDAAELGPALAEWTARLYERHRALHHVDVAVGPTVYRVFLLENGLQVDLAFT